MKYALLFSLVTGLFIFSSCEKLEFLDKKDKKEFDGKKEHDCKENKDKETCFDFIYPLSYNMPDGSTITGSEKELDIALKDWYIANPDSEAKPELLYPLDIVYLDGTSLSINAKEDWISAKEVCEKDKDACFDFVFPISYSMPDGDIISGTKEELENAMKDWYIANSDSEAKPELLYPIDIIYLDGTSETINVEEDWISAKEVCEGDDE